MGRNPRSSLVLQWLRIHVPMQGTWVQYLLWDDPTCRETTSKPPLVETSNEDPVQPKINKHAIPTSVFLPGEFHAQRSLAGYCPWGRRESDLTQQLILSLSLQERNGNVSISKRSLKERETEKTKK